ncbi:hypothetical protein IL972_00365 [Acinetobacter sp. FL51]|uniref:phage capsid protein n=1 Tax=Acinetobacter sp. FL51 TaxID=2777978 RepID=UPI0018E168AE|nr:phage capsid protein [Acinetobacter sp. FL51]MBI1450391.1 hypothetical protein [Acinetobacter sp. FL51]
MTNEYQLKQAFVKQYADSFQVAAQQRESRLLKTVNNIGIVEGSTFQALDMGALEMKPSNGRFGDTEWTIPETGERVALMADYDLFVPISPYDLPKLKANPQDKVMQNMLSARDRKQDDVIYQGLVGNATRKYRDASDVEQTQSLALPADQILLDAFGTLKQKVIEAKAIFRDNECDEANGEKLYILYNGDMQRLIMNDTQLTSADYLPIQMLQDGKVVNWMGFEWVPYNKLNVGAAEGKLRTAAYCGSALDFGHAEIKGFKVAERPDKKNVWQAGGAHSFGSVRVNEKKVVAIDFAT